MTTFMAMKTKKSDKVIADSSGLISLTSKTDSNRQKALETAHRFKRLGLTIIVPTDVFSEVINILGKKQGHQKAAEIADFIIDSEDFILADTLNCYLLALDKFKESQSSTSFTDCVVMAMADQYKTKIIFGFDKVFSKSGYKINF